MDQSRKHELLGKLIPYLLAECEDQEGQNKTEIPEDDGARWDLFRALVNTRPPWIASDKFLALQDELLQGLIEESGIATLDDACVCSLGGRMLLWRGDITRLKVDAIVNAANSQMLGCWQPGHHCIDNAIHTFAGIQLRRECAELMQEQGYPEPTGDAKITSAWNLPAKYVIHTVGPIAGGNPTELHREQLRACYLSCLDLAEERKLSSIAFCCISTGIFGFPKREAAEIAVHEVRSWLRMRPDANIRVVFNVFNEEDWSIYREVLDC